MKINEILKEISIKLPTKGLIRVYLSIHPFVYLEGILLSLFVHFVMRTFIMGTSLMHVTWLNKARKI